MLSRCDQAELIHEEKLNTVSSLSINVTGVVTMNLSGHEPLFAKPKRLIILKHKPINKPGNI